MSPRSMILSVAKISSPLENRRRRRDTCADQRRQRLRQIPFAGRLAEIGLDAPDRGDGIAINAETLSLRMRERIGVFAHRGAAVGDLLVVGQCREIIPDRRLEFGLVVRKARSPSARASRRCIALSNVCGGNALARDAGGCVAPRRKLSKSARAGAAHTEHAARIGRTTGSREIHAASIQSERKHATAMPDAVARHVANRSFILQTITCHPSQRRSRRTASRDVGSDERAKHRRKNPARHTDRRRCPARDPGPT